MRLARRPATYRRFATSDGERFEVGESCGAVIAAANQSLPSGLLKTLVFGHFWC
jgi:hypothetical protein